MIIKSIRLHNFRPFKGDHTIDFSTDGHRNVTVLMGQNGAGKTSLEQAFKWCMYGKTDFNVKEAINREVRDEALDGQDINCSVELSIVNNNMEYLIRRQHSYTKKAGKLGSVRETVYLKERDAHGDYKNLADYQITSTINSFLPAGLADFFFFDGEHLSNMSEELLEKNHSANFKAAVRGLVGLDAMLEAIEHLGEPNRKRTVLGKIDSLIDGVDNADLVEIGDEICNLQADCDNCAKKIDELKPAIERYQEDKQKAKNELQDMQDEINNRKKYDAYRRQHDSEMNKMVEGTGEFLNYYARRALEYYSIPLMREALDEIKVANKLEQAIPYIHADTIEFLLNRGACICGTDLNADQEASSRMRALIQALPPNSLSNTIGQFTAQVRARTRNGAEFWAEFKKKAIARDEHKKNASEALDAMTELEKSLSDQGRVSELRERIAKADNCIKNLNDNLFSLGSTMKDKERKLKDLERKRGEMRIACAKNDKNIIYLRYAEAVCKKLRESYGLKEEESRAELERRINKIFEDIYDGGIQIAVNRDYTVTTRVGTLSDDALEKNTAQSYAIIVAFIAAIIEMAKNKTDATGEKIHNDLEGFPLVMDAPLSAFDKERIQKICTTLPQIADQLIIFIKDTDGEIAEQYMSELIGKKWLIEQESQTRSSVIARG